MLHNNPTLNEASRLVRKEHEEEEQDIAEDLMGSSDPGELHDADRTEENEA